MTDDAPDTGNVLLDMVVFAAVTTIGITSGIVMGNALTERFRSKDKEDREVER